MNKKEIVGHLFKLKLLVENDLSDEQNVHFGDIMATLDEQELIRLQSEYINERLEKRMKN